LHTEDWLETGFLGFLLKLPRGVHVPMVRYGERWLLEFKRASNKVLDAIGAVEKGVFRVAVKMDEGHTVRIGGGQCR
ncbi:MAG TPA: hypothetical protein VIJ16_08280, partial [Gemmatimonadaceae bacterium]